MKIKHAALAAAVVSSVALITPAMAGMGSVRTVEGQSFWTGDPGPVYPGNFYASGQIAADPHHFMSYYGEDPQDYKMVVYADHSGGQRCVWRKRVVNTGWEERHPYLMVCRP